MSDKEGTIETLQRQLVQAGIKNKVMQGDVEVNKKVEAIKSDLDREKFQQEAANRVIKEKEFLESQNNLKQQEQRFRLKTDNALANRDINNLEE